MALAGGLANLVLVVWRAGDVLDFAYAIFCIICGVGVVRSNEEVA